MKQRLLDRNRRERNFGLMLLVAVLSFLVIQSVVISESQPPSGTLSEGYRDPHVRREHTFPESRGLRLARTRDHGGFQWDFRPSTYIPQEYVVSGRPRPYRAIVFSSGTVTDTSGQTVQLKGKGGLIIAGGQVRTTDRFRIRYRYDFVEDGQAFYSVADVHLTYVGTYNYRLYPGRHEDVQLFLSKQEEIPAYFLTKLDERLGSLRFGNRGGISLTIVQPDSVDGVPLPTDPLAAPVETVIFTGIVGEASLLPRNNPPELAGAEVFSFGEQTRVGRQFWQDNKPASLLSVALFRNKIPGLVRLSFLGSRQGRLLDVSRPRGPNNPNRNPFLAKNAFLTELKIVGPLHTLTLTGRYKDNRRGRIVIPPTAATLSFVDSLRLLDRVDVYATFTLDDAP